MRPAVERLVAGDPAARAMLEAAASVDTALHAMMHSVHRPLPRVSAARVQPMPSWRRLAGFGMAALAASLAIGFVVGTTLPNANDDDNSDFTTIAVNDVDLGGVL
jgi:ferric-dicitrate binding protein FerR (iron transport regulator)